MITLVDRIPSPPKRLSYSDLRSGHAYRDAVGCVYLAVAQVPERSLTDRQSYDSEVAAVKLVVFGMSPIIARGVLPAYNMTFEEVNLEISVIPK